MPDPQNPQPEQTSQKVELTSVQARSFTGPLPHPEILEHYDRISPGTSWQIIQWATDEGRHRRQIEAQVVDCNIAVERAGIDERRRAQFLAGGLAALMV